MAISAQRRAEIEKLAEQYRQGNVTKKKESEDPSLLQNIVQTVAKPFGKLGSSIAGIGEAAYDLSRGDVGGANEALSRERDLGYFGKVRPIGITETGGQMSTGAGIKDILGTGAEIGSYVVPGAGALKGVKTLGSTGISALPKVVADQALLGGVSGALGSAGAELQKPQSTIGSVLGEGIKGAAIGGAVGGVLPVAGAITRSVARPMVNVAGKVGSEILGRSTGAGEAAIREAFANPNAIKFARQAGIEGPEGLLSSALDDAQKGLTKLAETRGNTYRSSLEKIKLDKRSIDSIVEGVRGMAKELLADNDIKIGGGKLLNNLDFSKSAIEGGQNSVQKAFNTVMSWTDNTPAGLDTLKKKLGKFYNAIPREGAGDARNFVLELHNNVDKALKDNVKGYTEMTAGWREATELIEEIQRALSLKDTASKDTAVRKLMSTMRQNNELRLQLLQELGNAGKSDITGKIAGATLSARTPRGLAGTLQPTAIGITGITAPASIPALLLYLATTSPRLVAEFVSIIGKIKGKVISPSIQKQIRNILIRSANESTSSETPQENQVRSTVK